MFANHYDVVIVGAGPAGLIAGIESYNPSRKIVILEKMPRPALKLRISGRGRCNITNDASLDEFLSHFGKNGRFLMLTFSGTLKSSALRSSLSKAGVIFRRRIALGKLSRHCLTR